MPTRKEKEAMLDDLRERFKQSKVVIIADYRGLNVSAMTKLRRNLREKGCQLKVAKNTLTIKVAREIGMTGLESYLEGPSAIAFSSEDLVAPAKVFADFIKETKAFQIKGGILEGRIIDVKGVQELAALPSREILLSKVMGGMQTPLTGFASALTGVMRNLVYALEAIRKQKAAETA